MKGMLYQNDPALPVVFRKEGCRARSLMAMAEFTLDRALTALQIQLVIATAEKDPTILRAEDATAGANEHKITLYAFRLLAGYDWYYRQVGKWNGEKYLAWDGKTIIDPTTISYTELHWETDYEAGHWTLGSIDGPPKEVWDSWCTKPGFNPWDDEEGYTINKKSITEAYCYRLYKR